VLMTQGSITAWWWPTTPPLRLPMYPEPTSSVNPLSYGSANYSAFTNYSSPARTAWYATFCYCSCHMYCGLFVCALGIRVSCAKTAEPIEMSFDGWLLCIKGTMYYIGSRSPREGALLSFEGRHVPAHGDLPTHGKFANLAHAADDCIRHREGWRDKTAMRPFAKLFRTLCL